MSCCGSQCACVTSDSASVAWTGNGATGNPFVATVVLDPAAGNLLTVEAGGLRLDCDDLTACDLGGVSADVGNILTDGTDGRPFLNCAAVCACGCGGGGSESLATKTGDYTLVPADDVIVFNGTDLTGTLPDAATVVPGDRYVIKNIHATSLTVDAVGGDLIDGQASVTLGQWEALTFVSDLAQWLVV